MEGSRVYDAVVADEDEGVGRAKIDGDVVREQPGEKADQHISHPLGFRCKAE